MKIIVGTGHGEESAATLDLLGRLRFKDADARIVFVVERLASPAPIEANLSQDLLVRFRQLQDQEGRDRLTWAKTRLNAYGIEAATALRAGFIANELLTEAAEQKADLITVGSRDESALNKVLIGSVGRKLINKADRSLLVARGPLQSKEPIDAVFATDHSEYANRCLQELVRMAPQGIRSLTLMTAYPKPLLDSLQNLMSNFKGPLDSWITERLNEENNKVIKQLANLACTFHSRVVAGSVEDAIETTMQDTKSQLLILGAQGHGFVERLTMGSVSFQQAATGKYSTLILRV